MKKAIEYALSVAATLRTKSDQITSFSSISQTNNFML